VTRDHPDETMTEATETKLSPRARNGPAVLIVGAGPTGLTLACDLARRGISFRLIEVAPGPQPGSRGKGIQPRSL
jgi:2-polyprenyl-6-methoxyphenol hydroxylase-like FAD-dependent oxidoreductase